MRRREVVAGLGAAAAWPLVAHGQHSAVPVIGYLDASGLPPWFAAFRRGLTDLGYVQGQTIAVEYRSGAGRAERLPELAAELVHLRPRIIVASGSPAAVAVRDVTATIPIVFTFATDPVGVGLVASLARPGANITGQSNQAAGLVSQMCRSNCVQRQTVPLTRTSVQSRGCGFALTPPRRPHSLKTAPANHDGSDKQVFGANQQVPHRVSGLLRLIILA
jgi:ABC transporter substrate binding protein